MEDLLLEATSYKEFLRRYKKNSPFAIISAYQGSADKDTNIQNNKILRHKLSDENYDCVKLMGHFNEDSYYYESMIAFSTPEREEDFLRFLIFFAKKYNQNHIIFVDSNNMIWQYSTSTTSTIGGIGQKNRLYKFKTYDIYEIVDLYMKRTFSVDMVKVVTD